MTRSRKIILKVTSAVGVILLIPFVLIYLVASWILGGVTERYDAPTDPKSIKGGFHEEHRPSSLRNIYLWNHVEGFQIFEEFLRFEVDRQQIPEAVKM